jgi:hypothetical protein
MRGRACEAESGGGTLVYDVAGPLVGLPVCGRGLACDAVGRSTQVSGARTLSWTGTSAPPGVALEIRGLACAALIWLTTSAPAGLLARTGTGTGRGRFQLTKADGTGVVAWGMAHRNPARSFGHGSAAIMRREDTAAYARENSHMR